MKTIITTVLACGFFALTSFSQNIDINELLSRLEENHMGAVTDVFTLQELQVLREYIDANLEEPQIEFVGARRYESIQNVPMTVVAINPDDLNMVIERGPSNIMEFEGAGVVGPGMTQSFIIDNENGVWSRPLGQNLASKIGNITPPAPDQSFTGLEMTSTGELFGLSSNGMGTTTLSQIDPVTWGVTVIGNTGQTVGIALGRDSSDQLYSYDIDNDLMMRINKNTGVGTVLGPIGFDASFGQGMTYDDFTEKLYLTAFNNTIVDSQLREVNTTTGATINLGTIMPGTVAQFGWSSYYDPTLSINDVEVVDLKVYPNPFDDSLKIASNNNIQTVRIYNILGELVMHQTVNGTLIEIATNSLKSGLYMMEINTADESYLRKVVKK